MRVLIVYAHPNPNSFCHAVLQEFIAGLRDAGHTTEVIDLYAIKFDPVIRSQDYASFLEEGMPEDVLEDMNLKQQILNASGGPIRRFIAERWLRDKSLPELARFIMQQKPKDVIAQQEKVAQAQGLAFISPIYWVGFPAILKGWVERVFTLGFAFSLTSQGWKGDVAGRIPLFKHEKALIINTTLFGPEAYQGGLGEAMKRTIDDFGFRYPGIRCVEHVYFYSVGAVDLETRQGYLKQAYQLGKEYAGA